MEFSFFFILGEKIHEWKHSGGREYFTFEQIFISHACITHEFCKVYSIAQIFGVFNVVQNLYIRTYLGNTSFLGISLLKKFLSNFDSTEDFTLRIFFKFLFDI